MNRKEFKELTESKLVILDGGMGSCLISEGMPQGVCPEQWMIDNPDVQFKIQSQYAVNGADIIYAPTFTCNRPKLSLYNLEDKLEEINIKLVETARRAAQSADHKVYIAGDMTMTGIMLKPMGPMDFEELIDIYKEQVKALLKANVDLFIVETMMSLQETRACVIAIKELCDLPIMATLTFEADGKTLMGTDPGTAAITLEALGVDAVGCNCSTGPLNMATCIKKMSEVVNIPVIAKPNAGLPKLDDNGNSYYDNNPHDFAVQMKTILEAGATIVGGCCGTNPEYIKELVSMHYSKSASEKSLTGIRYLTSERATLRFSLDDNFMIIGERINPTGKKAFQESLRNSSLDMALEFASQQEANGAKILDVNVGMSGIDEKATMVKLVDELSYSTDLPLCIDTSYVDVMEAALRRYPGRALINSISGESAKTDALLSVAKKYGAMFIILPLDDKGIPESFDEKTAIINTIANKAIAMGFTKEDIVVDGLVTTVGANKNAGLQTLDTIKYCYNNGFATTCGLSNISFGLPQRGFVNATFLSMAIANGLTMAIANPNQNLIMSTSLAANMLRNKEGADLAYIERMNYIAESGADINSNNVLIVNARNSDNSSSDDIEKQLKNCVIKGKKESIASVTQKCLEKGIEPNIILNKILIPSINEVGELFEKGKYFLPQLIAGAEAMKVSIDCIEPLMSRESEGKELPTVIIASVEGDIHDIGKNLVALMLKNYGFNVIDLGKDVKKEEIIQSAKENSADIIALSALMTTTMKKMQEVVELAKCEGVGSKIIIGGAVTSQLYADEIGADGYSSDAAQAVKLCKSLLYME